MRAVGCGANGAMGQLLCSCLGDEVMGLVSYGETRRAL